MVERVRKGAGAKGRRALIVGGLAIVTISVGLASFGFSAGDRSPAPATGAPAGLGVLKTDTSRAALPEVTFEDGSGRTVSLSDFHGKLVLLNLWATWCGPCVEEMPSLERLAKKLGPQGLVVLPLSQDRGGAAVVQKFFAEHNLSALPIYVDKTMRSGGALGTRGLPTTILIDPNGKEIGRLEGDYDWDSAASEKMLRSYLKPPSPAESKT
jgi:thiol-disulfide isomerase/thioredoxin